ncbi:histidine kinase [Fulvivirgaceae bacterium BMA12]|uniref:Histidine kinase n=1 Tax=Agaribacillus aureus TaxID=3051825 RepID=A0ABT8LAU5_9BACT|nr:histidine kinase [Fulvivirgaceae bacterium BMA12]
MKRKKTWLLTLLLTLTVGFSLQAQKKIDSLRQLSEATPAGPDKFKLYGNICWYYINQLQLELALNYADSISLSAEALGDKDGIALAQFYYGVIARKKGRHEKALKHMNAYVNHYVAIGDSTKVAHGLFQIGAINSDIGNYEPSLSALYRSLKILEKQEDQGSINFTLNVIGSVLRSAKRYDDALEVYEKVLQTDSLNSDVMLNMGNVFSETDELEAAKVYYLKALKIDRANENDWAIAYDLENLGNLMSRMKLHDSALVYQKKALEIREALPNKKDEAISLSQVGAAYTRVKNYLPGLAHLTRALDLAKETNTTYLIRDIYEKLAIHFSAQKNFEEAYGYIKQYTILNDSLLNERVTKQISEAKTKYESEKKDQQITLLAKEKELQKKEAQRQATLKNTFIFGGLLIALLAGLLVYTLRQRLRNQKAFALKDNEIKEANFRQQLSELEMKALQAQINPHFIFNCLNSINQMILEGETEPASRYLTKFSRLIRLILENSETAEVSLKNELTLLESYIQLESLRFSGEIQYKIRIKDNIDTEATYLPSMVLQPFVENAIWHGLRHKKEPEEGIIAISIDHDKGQLLCEIQDNGVGREKALELQQRSVWKSKSLGLKITEERLRLLSQELQKQLIRITDLKDAVGQSLGTRVEVSIPTS